ncbi:MAG: hypothetical protein DMD72_07910, partial [Gemmatimonadetes bacterium]
MAGITNFWGWIVFAILVLGAVAFDVGLLRRSRDDTGPLSLRTAGFRSAGWIGLALIFGLGVTAVSGADAGLTYTTAYF